MEITAASFFGLAFIALGVYTIIKKRVTISWGESETAPETQFTGTKSLAIGITLILIGCLIITSDTFSQHVIVKL